MVLEVWKENRPGRIDQEWAAKKLWTMTEVDVWPALHDHVVVPELGGFGERQVVRRVWILEGLEPSLRCYVAWFPEIDQQEPARRGSASASV